MKDKRPERKKFNFSDRKNRGEPPQTPSQTTPQTAEQTPQSPATPTKQKATTIKTPILVKCPKLEGKVLVPQYGEGVCATTITKDNKHRCMKCGEIIGESGNEKGHSFARKL